MARTRREFLKVAGAAALGVAAPSIVAATTSLGAKSSPAADSVLGKSSRSADAARTPAAAARNSVDLAAARQDLRRLVSARALVVDDPWVLMHTVLPLGRDARHGSEPVVDFVIRTWIEGFSAGGKSYPAFPVRIEAHPNHFLQIMYATAVPADRRFDCKLGPITRTDLYAGAKALFTPALQGDELSWTVSVFSAEMAPGADGFTNGDGRSFTVAAVVETAAQAAEAGYADTIAAMRGAKPYGRSAIQGYACNGTHVIYGLLDALRHGYRDGQLPDRVTTLVRAALFRLGPEVALIDEAIGGAGKAEAELNADAAKLQFLGHSLENLAFAREHALYRTSPVEEEAVAAAERELAAVAHRLVAKHDLDGLARQVPRAYRVILGDACHALHGLESGRI